MKCGVCSREWPKEHCRTIVLTAVERAYVMAATGGAAPDEYVYCNPCWKLLSNRQQGAQFIAGSFQASFQASGHPKAAQVGKKMLNFLIAKSGKPVS